MHTFTSLNWLASHPPEPEPSHPVRLSEETGEETHKRGSIFISDIKETQSEILEISQHTCVFMLLI